MPKYTIVQFRKEYGNEAKCLDKLFELQYGKINACPHCGVVNAKFRRITTRRCYQCRECYHQFYPTAGTIFEKTTTPLTHWFYAMYLMSVTRNGVSAKELERQLGVSYKCAWRMAKQIRVLMGRRKRSKFKGIVEVDETYVGGKTEKNTGRSTKEKAPVVAIVKRGGNAEAKVVDNVKKETVYPLIILNVDLEGSHVMTDEFAVYTNLSSETGFKHSSIKHQLKRYRRGNTTTNSVEGFFSHLKRMIWGTHIWVSRKYLQHYVDEHVFRFNLRGRPSEMFMFMLNGV